MGSKPMARLWCEYLTAESVDWFSFNKGCKSPKAFVKEELSIIAQREIMFLTFMAFLVVLSFFFVIVLVNLSAALMNTQQQGNYDFP